MNKLNIVRIIATIIILYSALVSFIEPCPEPVSCGAAEVCKLPLSFCCTNPYLGFVVLWIFLSLLWIAPYLDRKYRDQYDKVFPMPM